MSAIERIRTLDEWLFAQTEADRVCVNRFHDIAQKVYEGYSDLDPMAPDEDDFRTKVAQLMRARLVLLGGDVIYVREGDTLHTLGDSIDLLSYYMHTDSKEARKAMDLLETNFQGYFPVTDGLVWRDVMRIDYPDGRQCFVNLRTLRDAERDPWESRRAIPSSASVGSTRRTMVPSAASSVCSTRRSARTGSLRRP